MVAGETGIDFSKNDSGESCDSMVYPQLFNMRVKELRIEASSSMMYMWPISLKMLYLSDI
jgi:hypothetical protein